LEKGDLGGFKKASNSPQIPYNQDFLLEFAGFTQRAQRLRKERFVFSWIALRALRTVATAA
jgi:hypothetical protein